MEEQPLHGDTLLSEWGPLSIVRTQPSQAAGTRVNIIQHPRGEEKRIAIRSSYCVGRIPLPDQPARIQYRTDTEPGPSGPPILDNNCQGVAMYHAAIKVPESQCKGELVKYNNQGIEIHAILEDLEESVRSQMASFTDE